MKEEVKSLNEKGIGQNRRIAGILRDFYKQYPERTPMESWDQLKDDPRIKSCSGNFFKVSKVVRECKSSLVEDYIQGRISFSKLYAQIKGSTKPADPLVAEKLALIAREIKETYSAFSPEEKESIRRSAILLIALGREGKV